MIGLNPPVRGADDVAVGGGMDDHSRAVFENPAAFAGDGGGDARGVIERMHMEVIGEEEGVVILRGFADVADFGTGHESDVFAVAGGEGFGAAFHGVRLVEPGAFQVAVDRVGWDGKVGDASADQFLRVAGEGQERARVLKADFALDVGRAGGKARQAETAVTARRAETDFPAFEEDDALAAFQQAECAGKARKAAADDADIGAVVAV